MLCCDYLEVLCICYWPLMRFHSVKCRWRSHIDYLLTHIYTSANLSHNRQPSLETFRGKKHGVFLRASLSAMLLHPSDWVFCWVTLFLMRLQQTVNSPTQSLEMGHKHGRDGANKREVEEKPITRLWSHKSPLLICRESRLVLISGCGWQSQSSPVALPRFSQQCPNVQKSQQCYCTLLN